MELHVRERDGVYRPATAAEIRAAALAHLHAYRMRRGRALSSPSCCRIRVPTSTTAVGRVRMRI